MNFLAGEGEMARRMREFDWAGHPFGPAEAWPQSLRSALSICLNSAFPTAIYWGSELRLLYNDAWAPIPGPRHPDALGAPAREVWSDIWHIIEPQFIEVIETGRGLHLEDQLLPMRRYGFEEETYWNYNFTPIRGEDGAIQGVFNSGNETTRNVLQSRQSAFLLSLTDRLRECATRSAARSVLLEALGRHLEVDAAGMRELDPMDGSFDIAATWNRPGIDLAGRKRDFTDLGSPIVDMMHAGKILRLDTTDAPEGAVLRDLGWGATLSLPWMVHGELSAMLYMHSTEERHWTDDEVSTARHALERAMNVFQNLEAAAREKVMTREINHRARNLLAVVNSIVRQARADTLDDYREKLMDRLAALASTHTLLSDRNWAGLTVQHLLDQELSPYTGTEEADRVALRGPKVVLEPETAQGLAMVFHELATNAAKHGALGAPEGRLSVNWNSASNGAVSVTWAETAPAREVPTEARRRGFGTTLLSSIVETQLGGHFERQFLPEGLRCEIVLPLSEADAEAVQEAATAPPEPAAQPRPETPTILVVEDEMLVALDMIETLKELGYEIFASAANLQVGMAALAGPTQPSAVLLDANLNGVSSQPIADALADRGIPFVVVTGYSGEALDSFRTPLRLTKPIAEAELADVLGKALAGS